MNSTICILFSGLKNLDGVSAVQLVERFKLKSYGGVKLGQMGELYYANFDNTIETENSEENLRKIASLFIWFGLHKVKFRIDRSILSDSTIDFQLHMVQELSYITIPKVLYAGR